MTEVNRRKNILWLPGKIINIETVETPQGNVNVPVPISNTSKIKTAKKYRKKYEKIRKERAKKLAQIKGVEIIELPKPSSKSARITAKKISNKYKKIRNKRNIHVVEEIREVASKKSAQIAAKKISDKYKKMRYKKPSPTFFVNEEDIEIIDYNDDTSTDDVLSNRGATIAANKIKNKYKKMKAKRNKIPFGLDEIEQGGTINYVDDTDIADVKLNKNAIIAAKKIVEKYKGIERKRKRRRCEPEPIEGPAKKTGTQSKKSVIIAARMITEKYKKMTNK